MPFAVQRLGSNTMAATATTRTGALCNRLVLPSPAPLLYARSKQPETRVRKGTREAKDEEEASRIHFKLHAPLRSDSALPLKVKSQGLITGPAWAPNPKG